MGAELRVPGHQAVQKFLNSAKNIICGLSGQIPSQKGGAALVRHCVNPRAAPDQPQVDDRVSQIGMVFLLVGRKEFAAQGGDHMCHLLDCVDPPLRKGAVVGPAGDVDVDVGAAPVAESHRHLRRFSHHRHVRSDPLLHQIGSSLIHILFVRHEGQQQVSGKIAACPLQQDSAHDHGGDGALGVAAAPAVQAVLPYFRLKRRNLHVVCHVGVEVSGIHQPFPRPLSVENAHHGRPVGFHLIEGSLQT